MHAENRLYIMDISALASEEVFSRWYAQMPAYRKEKISRIKTARSRRQSLAAGILLDRALCDTGITGYGISAGEHGKPYVMGYSGICFSLSHSEDMAALGISGREIGVDIQRVRHFSEKLKSRVFSEAELSEARRLCAEGADMDTVCTRMWTMKEAIMKHSGIGIGLAPEAITISFPDGQPQASCEKYDSEGLSLIEYAIYGYALTVCTGYEEFDMAPTWVRLQG